jgi:hypothetical protein
MVCSLIKSKPKKNMGHIRRSCQGVGLVRDVPHPPKQSTPKFLLTQEIPSVESIMKSQCGVRLRS